MNYTRIFLPCSQIITWIFSRKICDYYKNRLRQINYMNLYLGFPGIGFLWQKTSKESESKEKNIAQILEKADKEFDHGHYEECYHILIKSGSQNDTEITWRLCRVLFNMSKDTKYDKEYKKDLICSAYRIISHELPNQPENYAFQKWYALILDAKTSYDGYKEKITQLENIKQHMDLAVNLNPNDAAMLHMLGEWCYQLSEIPWHQRKIAESMFASLPKSCYEDALEYYLKAEAAQPRFYSINLLRIGCCYLKLNKEDQAKYYLQLAASYPAKSNDDHQANKEAAELLKKLNKCLLSNVYSK